MNEMPILGVNDVSDAEATSMSPNHSPFPLLARNANDDTGKAVAAKDPVMASMGKLIASLASDHILFSDKVYLSANPDVQAAVRQGSGSAFEHWVNHGAEEGRNGFTDWERTIILEKTKPIVLAFHHLINDNTDAALANLSQSLIHLGRRDADNPILGAKQLLSEVELWTGREFQEDRGLVGAVLFLAGLITTQIASEQTFTQSWFIRLTPVLTKLYSGQPYPNRQSDFSWWSHIVQWLLPKQRDYSVLKALMLRAGERPSPAVPLKKRSIPRPTERMARLLNIWWSATALLAHQPLDALGVALSLMREMTSSRERRCYCWCRDEMLSSYQALKAGEPIDARKLFDVLVAIFRTTFGGQHLSLVLSMFEVLGVRHVSQVPETFENEDEDYVYDYAFLIGLQDGESRRYRVLNVADALEAQGFKVTTIALYEAEECLSRCNIVHNLIVFRAALTDQVYNSMALARRKGARIIFDIDDLFFEPELASHIRGIDLLNPADKAGTKVGIELYRAALFASDAASFSTSMLADLGKRNGIPSFVLPNTHGPFERLIAEISTASKHQDKVIVAYFSGTWTHHADFAECEEALLRIMREHEDVAFLLVGHLDLGPKWSELLHRVIRIPFLPHPLMLPVYNIVDISLAPLEMNPFCESKSELKIFEAALYGVPTVATMTGPYRSAIEDRVSGRLTSDSEGWYRALKDLVVDTNLRRAMGDNAREACIRNYSDSNLARLYCDQLQMLQPRFPARRANGTTRPRSLNICMTVPDVSAGSGGFRSLFRLCQHLSLFGHRIVLCLLDSSASDAALRDFICESFGNFSFTITTKAPPIPYDLVIATFWTTVRRARDIARSVGGKSVYFVQDFEPWFYPLGNDYFQAEETYRLGVPMVTYTPFLTRMFKETYGASSKYVDMVIDRSVYYQRPECRRKLNRVVFLARPEMPRRCYGISVNALRMLKSQRPELDIIFYGSNHVDEVQLGFPITNLGIINDLHALARLYSEGAIGLSISPTNPSHVPFEMLACNMPVVDVAWAASRYNDLELGHIMHYSEPTAEGLMQAMIDLLDDPELRQRKLKSAADYLIRFPGPIEQARQFESHLIDIVSSETVQTV